MTTKFLSEIINKNIDVAIEKYITTIMDDIKDKVSSYITKLNNGEVLGKEMLMSLTLSDIKVFTTYSTDNNLYFKIINKVVDVLYDEVSKFIAGFCISHERYVYSSTCSFYISVK
jgi:hypothetical protein